MEISFAVVLAPPPYLNHIKWSFSVEFQLLNIGSSLVTENSPII